MATHARPVCGVAERSHLAADSHRAGDGLLAAVHAPMAQGGVLGGGDGGRGADIIFQVDNGLNTLLYFRYHRKFTGKNGENGDIKNQYGHNAPPCVVKVPPGTVVYDEDTGE